MEQGSKKSKNKKDPSSHEDADLLEHVENPSDESLVDESSKVRKPIAEDGQPSGDMSTRGVSGLLGRTRAGNMSDVADVLSSLEKLATTPELAIKLKAVADQAAYILGSMAFTPAMNQQVEIAWDKAGASGPTGYGGGGQGAIRTATNWPRQFTIANIGVNATPSAANPSGGPDMGQFNLRYFDPNAMLTAMVLTGDYGSVAESSSEIASSFFDGTTYHLSGGYPALLTPEYTARGEEVIGPGVMKGFIARLMHTLKFIESTQVIVTSPSGPENFALDYRYNDIIEDDEKGTGQKFEDFIPPPPYQTAWWPSGHVKREVALEFGPGRPLPTIVPRQEAVVDRWTWGNYSYRRNIMHSVDPISAMLNTFYNVRVDEYQGEYDDMHYMLNLLKNPQDDYVLDANVLTSMVKADLHGKRMLDALVMTVDEFRKAEMAKSMARMERANLMVSRDGLELESLRDAVRRIGQAGQGSAMKNEITSAGLAALTTGINARDLLKLLVSEQFALFEPATIKISDKVDVLSGDTFVDWLNSMLIYLVFDGLSPQSIGALFTQGLWLFGLQNQTGTTGFSETHKSYTPKPSDLFKMKKAYPLLLRHAVPRSASTSVKNYVALFARGNRTDSVPGYNPQRLTRMFGITASPFDVTNNLMRGKFYHHQPGTSQTVWHTTLTTWFGKLQHFLQNLVSPSIVVPGRDVSMMLQFVQALQSNVAHTDDPVAVIIGNLRLLQCVDTTQFRCTYYQGQETDKWLDEHNPGHYAMQVREINSDLAVADYVTPTGRAYGNTLRANEIWHQETIVSRDPPDPIKFNMIGFLFGVKANPDYTLCDEPDKIMLEQTEATWDASKYIRVSMTVKRIMEGDMGRHGRYALWLSRGRSSRGVIAALWDAVSEALGVRATDSYTSQSTAAMGLKAKLGLDFSTTQVGVKNAQGNYVWTDFEIFSPWEEILTSIAPAILDGNEGMEHWTHYVLMKRTNTLGLDFDNMIRGNSYKVIRKIGQGPRNNAIGTRPITSGYYLMVSKHSYIYRDGEIMSPNRLVSYAEDEYEPKSLDEILQDKKFHYYIDYFSFAELDTPVRVQLHRAIQGTFDLLIGGKFKYRYYMVDSFGALEFTDVLNWFKNPSQVTEFTVPYINPSQFPRFVDTHREYHVALPQYDGFIWQLPSVEEALLQTEPSDFRVFQALSLTMTEVSQLLGTGDFVDAIERVILRGAHLRLYSKVNFMLHGGTEKPGETTGIRFNRPAYKHSALPFH